MTKSKFEKRYTGVGWDWYLETDEGSSWVPHMVKDHIERLESENEELRNELGQWERLTANVELPEYPVTQFVPKDLERENAKLRALVRKLLWGYDHDLPPADTLTWWGGVLTQLRELGIEED